MKKKINLSSVAFLTIVNITYGQVGVNNSAPQSTLDIKAINPTGTVSNTDGILVPRIDRQRAQNMTSIETSTIIYINNFATGSPTGKAQKIDNTGFYYFNGSLWEKLFYIDKSSLTGTLKYSVKTNDHNGWYLLDGRAITTFSASVQVRAQALGFTVSIPNASDRVLKTRTAAETPGTLGGSNLLTILQSNLPNITLSSNTNGTTTASGAHAHDPAEGNAFLLSGTNSGNNGNGYGNAGSIAWGGVNARGTTAIAGIHNHTFAGTVNTSLGGGDEPIDNRSPYLSVNTFIYLGE